MTRLLFASGVIQAAAEKAARTFGADIAPGSRTVRVRIAVAIRGGTDEWAACGGSETEDHQARREVVDCFDAGDPVNVVWVEAEVAVAVEVTVEGSAG